LARAAHLFCELHTRLEVVGLANGEGYALPLTQQELSECLGLTPVHTNRVLRQLRERGLLTFKSSQVTVEDRRTLERVAEFDPAYLYLQKRTR
jgi:CRP-like cAMP-binding protein